MSWSVYDFMPLNISLKRSFKACLLQIPGMRLAPILPLGYRVVVVRAFSTGD